MKHFRFLPAALVLIVSLDSASLGGSLLPVSLVEMALGGLSGPMLTATKEDALSHDADMDGNADLGDIIEYTVVITNTGGMDAVNTVFTDTIDPNTTLVPGSLSITPIARHDAYDSFGNVGISVSAGDGVLANDNDPDDGPAPLTTVVAVQGNGANVGNATDTDASVGGVFGSVTLDADGSFTYTPPPGFAGMDTFTYTAEDDEGDTDDATVTITIADRLWFIDNSATGNNTGTLTDPFQSIGDFNGSAGPGTGDRIYLATGNADYTTGINLQDDQVLVGEGATGADLQTLFNLTLPPHSPPLPPINGGTRPVITSADNGIDLAANNTIRGLNLGDVPAANSRLAGTSVGSLTVDEVAISSTGAVIRVITGGTLNVTLDSAVSTASSGGPAIELVDVTGSLTVDNSGLAPHTSISGADAGISIQNSSATFLFGDTTVTTDATGGDGVDLGGTTPNPTASVTFDSLSVTTAAGGGLLANGGTVNIGGVANTISATAGSALDVTNTSIGTGWTFASLASTSAPAAEGIFLDGLTGTGGFTVTGTTIVTDANTPFGGITVQDSAGVTNYSFGTTTLDDTNIGGGAMANGIDLRTSNSTASFTFDSLSVTTDGGAGLLADNSGTINLTGTSATINATGGPAVDINNTIGQTGGASGWTFASLTSTNSNAEGIKLNNLSDDFTVTGSTTVTNSTNEGIEVDNSGAAVAYSFMTVDIEDSGANGIDLASLDGSFSILSTGGGITFPTGTNNNFGVHAVDVADLSISGVSGNRFLIDRAGSGNTDVIGGNRGPHGIFVQGSANVSLDFVKIDNMGETTTLEEEDAIFLLDTTMSIVVTNCEISRHPDGDGIHVRNATTSLSGDVRIGVDASGTPAANTFGPTTGVQDAHRSIAIDVTGFGNTLEAFIQYNSIMNEGDYVVGAGAGIDVLVQEEAGAGGSLPVRVTIANNTLIDRAGDNISIDALTGGRIQTLVEVNAITGNEPNACTSDPSFFTGSGCRESAIEITSLAESTGVMREASIEATVRNNTITGFEGAGTAFPTILVVLQGNSGPALMNALIEGHTIVNPNGFGTRLRANSNGTMRATLRNNDFFATDDGIELDVTTSTGATTVELYLDGNNSSIFDLERGGSSPNPVDTVRLACETGCPVSSIITTDSAVQSLLNYNGNNTGGGSSNVNVGGSSPNSFSVISAPITLPILPLMVADHSGAAVVGQPSLTDAELHDIVQAAIRRWSALGLSESQRTRLARARIRIDDLQVGQLADTALSTVRIDVDAAGHGWFIDATPGTDEEFTWRSPSAERFAKAASTASNRIDLLTVVMHELGHVMGWGHEDVPALMADALPVGVRRLPAPETALTQPLQTVEKAASKASSIDETPDRRTVPDQDDRTADKSAEASSASGAREPSNPSMSSMSVDGLLKPLVLRETVLDLTSAAARLGAMIGRATHGQFPTDPIDLGTLNPGQTVTITFRVTVNSLPLSEEICNQGEVSHDDSPSGTITVVTDDPDEAGTADLTCTPAPFDLDFGDAPDPTYPTLFASNGASHTLGSGLFLGAGVDEEADGQPNATATGDDTDGNDDEDGVLFTSPLVAGTLATLDVTASGAGLLNAWIDLNGNGSWGDVGEHVFADEPLAAGVNNLVFAVPCTVTTGDTFARFRISTESGLSFDGAAQDGEVEDYLVTLGECDDDDTCTLDVCADGICTSTPRWQILDPIEGCDDGDFCTLDICDRLDGTFECDNIPIPDLDADNDGLPDFCDNCILHANPDQLNADDDIFGNACDADKNNDCVVDELDQAIFIAAFGTADAECDLNGDGIVGMPDYRIFLSLFGRPVGPSGFGVCQPAVP